MEQSIPSKPVSFSETNIPGPGCSKRSSSDTGVCKTKTAGAVTAPDGLQLRHPLSRSSGAFSLRTDSGVWEAPGECGAEELHGMI